jgi:hypothetical protein
MADTTVEAAAANSVDTANGLWGPYWVDGNVGAILFLDTSNNPNARKTTTGGTTWENAVEAAAEIAHHMGCVFDREVAGDTGTLAHCAWLDSGNNRIRYRAFDISANTWGTVRTVATGVAENLFLALNGIVVTKARSGRIVVGWSNGETAFGSAETVDGGANWTAITSIFETGGAGDAGRHAYCNTDDDADVAVVFIDADATEMSIKVHDDSADTVTETLIASGFVDPGSPTHRTHFSTTTRLSDGHVLVAAWTQEDNVAADILTFDLLIDSVAAPTVTAKTNILTNTGEGGNVGIFVDQLTDHVYAAYSRGGTWASTTTIYYKKSIDGMATWGSETAMSADAADDHRAVSVGAMGPLAGRFMPAWFDDDDLDIFVNTNNSLTFPTSGKGSGGKGKGGNTPGPGEPPKKPLRTSLSKSWKWDRGWR